MNSRPRGPGYFHAFARTNMSRHAETPGPALASRTSPQAAHTRHPDWLPAVERFAKTRADRLTPIGGFVTEQGCLLHEDEDVLAVVTLGSPRKDLQFPYTGHGIALCKSRWRSLAILKHFSEILSRMVIDIRLRRLTIADASCFGSLRATSFGSDRSAGRFFSFSGCFVSILRSHRTR